ITRYWTPYQRNVQLIPMAGNALLNRAFWMGVWIGILSFFFARFFFAFPPQRTRRQKPGLDVEESPGSIAPAFAVVHPPLSLGIALRELLSLTRLQFKETVKNIFFVVLVLAGAIFAILSGTGINNPFATRVYPVTWRMLELAGSGFTLFALAIITFYSGELV